MANILIACLGVRIPIPLSISNLRYFLYVRARRIVNKGTLDKAFSEDTIDADAPCLESYNERCKNVDYHGQRQVNRMGDVDDSRSHRKNLKVVVYPFGRN
jgi:hypothetical protein